MVVLLNLQVKVRTVTQHGPLILRLPQQAKDPQGQIQDQAHPGLNRARSKVHGYRLNNVHLREGRIKLVNKVQVIKLL